MMPFTYRKKIGERVSFSAGEEKRGDRVRQLGRVHPNTVFLLFVQESDDKIILLNDQWNVKLKEY